MQKLAISASPECATTAEHDAARTRLLLYLQAQDLPPAQADWLVEKALATAREAQPAMLLPAAMATLQTLLADQLEPVAMPQLQRQPMRPEPLDRSAAQWLRDDLLAPLAGAAQRLLQTLQRRTGLLSLVAAVVLAVGYRHVG